MKPLLCFTERKMCCILKKDFELEIIDRWLNKELPLKVSLEQVGHIFKNQYQIWYLKKKSNGADWMILIRKQPLTESVWFVSIFSIITPTHDLKTTDVDIFLLWSNFWPKWLPEWSPIMKYARAAATYIVPCPLDLPYMEIIIIKCASLLVCFLLW